MSGSGLCVEVFGCRVEGLQLRVQEGRVQDMSEGLAVRLTHNSRIMIHRFKFAWVVHG